jgi:hypothetical protein
MCKPRALRSLKPEVADSGSPALHVIAQCSIDTCLITFIGRRVFLEPSDDIGIEAKCQFSA